MAEQTDTSRPRMTHAERPALHPETGSVNFTDQQYALLCHLCETIIPRDARSGGALEAGVPQFIAVMVGERDDYANIIHEGLIWLDAFCVNQYKKTFLECHIRAQCEVIDLVAWRNNSILMPELTLGVAFFSLLRKLTVDGFFTSAIGITDLGYVGNTSLEEFCGCPPLPVPRDPER